MIFEQRQEVTYYPNGQVDEIKQIKSLRRAQPLSIGDAGGQRRQKVVTCRKSFYFYDDQLIDQKAIQQAVSHKPPLSRSMSFHPQKSINNGPNSKTVLLIALAVAAVVMYFIGRDHDHHVPAGSGMRDTELLLPANYSTGHITEMYRAILSQGVSVSEALQEIEQTYRQFLHDFEWDSLLREIGVSQPQSNQPVEAAPEL